MKKKKKSPVSPVIDPAQEDAVEAGAKSQPSIEAGADSQLQLKKKSPVMEKHPVMNPAQVKAGADSQPQLKKHPVMDPAQEDAVKAGADSQPQLKKHPVMDPAQEDAVKAGADSQLQLKKKNPVNNSRSRSKANSKLIKIVYKQENISGLIYIDYF